MMKSFARLSALVALILSLTPAFATHVSIPPIPAPVRSIWFSVSIDGHRTPVVHAASSYYLLTFDYDGPATVSVRAPDAHYWDRGVEIQPMRYGIRPVRRGAVITFPIPGPQNGPVKLVIARPGDHFFNSQMLFLIGNPPVVPTPRVAAATPGIRWYGPGLHRESIDAHSGDRIYLAPGAVVFGSLNLWQVHNVRVYGRGIIVYNGPQTPYDDTGWIHRPNWHCIVSDHARNIEIDGLTCIVRSRTWQVQLTDSEHMGLYNINIIGGNPSNANQDGIDFVGSRDVTVRDAFIRAGDDDLAIMGNWGGYTSQAMRAPGPSVDDITVEDSVLSTSISNTIRVGWPQKTFASAHIRFRSLDVVNTGYGACVVPFAFFEMWTDPHGIESHTDYRISDIRLENYYSLLQIRQPDSEVRGIVFSNIAAMDGPPMVPSVLSGKDVHGVVLQDIHTIGSLAWQDQQIPLHVKPGTPRPELILRSGHASWDYRPSLIRPHDVVTFQVLRPAPGWHYRWLFGDGTAADGATVRHAFPDTEGTLLDGSGRFRVLLRASSPGHSDEWSSRSVVVARALPPHVFLQLPPWPLVFGLQRESIQSGKGRGDVEWSGFLRIPADGGYTFTLLTSRVATLQIDDLPPARSPAPRMEVCGSMGDAVQATRLSANLRAGLHVIDIVLAPGVENEPLGPNAQPTLYWEGPQTPLAPVAASALLHASSPADH